MASRIWQQLVAASLRGANLGAVIFGSLVFQGLLK